MKIGKTTSPHVRNSLSNYSKIIEDIKHLCLQLKTVKILHNYLFQVLGSQVCKINRFWCIYKRHPHVNFINVENWDGPVFTFINDVFQVLEEEYGNRCNVYRKSKEKNVHRFVTLDMAASIFATLFLVSHDVFNAQSLALQS